ncbi:MAG TPA: FAD-dependent oxidoreductase [Candidatus Acidoferrum sp.]|nr:FAD-dependent oxidoreductase [Candidatus Acidoferrum sp.]
MKKRGLRTALALALAMVLALSAGAASYTVAPGDVLWRIAQKYGTTYQELAAFNGIANPNLIFPGQIIQIPEPAGGQKPAQPPAPEPPEQPAAPVAVTHTVTTKGNNGDVVVATSFFDGDITAVEVVSHKETPGISDAAIERIPAAIAEYDTVNVDTVAGATNTSNAILSAVRQAIEKEGLRVEDYMGEVGKGVAQAKSYTAEVLIIGAGGSGLAAANAALANGADVLVIEKMATPGGATAISGGGFIGGASALQRSYGIPDDSPDLMYADLLAGGITNDARLLRLFVDNVGATIDWMKGELKLPIDPAAPGTSVEHSRNRGFRMTGGASAITGSLADVYEATGGKLLTETKATELIVEGGRVCGALATDEATGAAVTIRADKVILATGGYGNNPDLLPESVSDILYYGPVCATGDGLFMARAVGAASHFMDKVKIYPQGVEVAPGKAKVSTGASMAATKVSGAIYVNQNGERVVNENAAFTVIRDVTLLQPGRILYLVLDQKGFEVWRANSSLIGDTVVEQMLAQNGGTPLLGHGDTLEAIAGKAGIDAAKLTATVEQYNAMAAAGTDADFGKAEPIALGAGPYYIVEQKLRFASTLGGLNISNGMEVLNTAGVAIPGLYAAGEIVGGVHGNDSMPSCNVGWALTSGRLAGEAVSAD